MRVLYDFDYFRHLYINVWEARQLRFVDAYPALAYSFGLTDADIEPWMFNTEFETVKEEWVIERQLQMINSLKSRSPKKVFEIGGGRGELACAFRQLEIEIDSCEFSTSSPEWYTKTGQHFFGYEFRAPTPIVGHIKDITVDWSLYDTIIMVETIEHIKEEDFRPIWNNIVENFKGYFIITNHPGTHPIPIGDWGDGAEKEHCRIIDDAVYNEMAAKAKRTILRKGSHLVLEF